MADERTREEVPDTPTTIDAEQAIEFAPAPEDEGKGSPEPKRSHPSFGIGKVGIAIILVLAVVLVGWRIGFTPNPEAIGRDAGGFAGGSDYGGSDWGGSSSYDYDWGGSSSYDYDYSYEDYYETSFIDVVIVLIIVGVIFGHGFLPPRGGSSRGRSTSPKPVGAQKTPDSKLRPISKLVERDPLFSSAAVEEQVANVYVRMQQAWTAGDFEPMRPYFSNMLFSQFSSQLASLTKRGHTNYVEDIAVLETTVRGWYETSGNEYLVLKVRTRITDYTMDKAGKVVGGFTDAESYMEYEYVLGRSAGTRTTAQVAQTTAGECPNCGAPINLAQNAKCPYCGTVVESSRFTWVITAIKGISQHIEH